MAQYHQLLSHEGPQEAKELYGQMLAKRAGEQKAKTLHKAEQAKGAGPLERPARCTRPVRPTYRVWVAGAKPCEASPRFQVQGSIKLERLLGPEIFFF